MPRKPIALRPGDKGNFETLRQALKNGDLALVSAVRKADDADVALICAMGGDEQGNIYPSPLAVMIEGNPFDLFEDPTEIIEDNDCVQNGKPAAQPDAKQLALFGLAAMGKAHVTNSNESPEIALAMSELVDELSARGAAIKP
jgi:hypothetical protein